MAYISLYRKYRAQTFDQVMGQGHIVTTLQNAVRQNKFSHAYLLCGPRGTGKTTTARLIAKALNCENGPTPEPCDECHFCVQIRQGSCMDVVEMDAASETSIDDVRGAIVENAKYAPMEARYKVYIIDEAHDLSAKAFDALLKTIEEPPPHVVFILATTEFNKVPITIRSRCQRFDFHRGSVADIVKRMEFVLQSEGIEYEAPALLAIARLADGSWRDALTALEQAIAYSSDKVSVDTVYDALGIVEEDALRELVDRLIEGDQAGILAQVHEQSRRGREARIIAESLLNRIRSLMHAQLNVETAAQQYETPVWAALVEQARRVGTARLLAWWQKLSQAISDMRVAGAPRIVLELALLSIADQPVQVAPAVAQAPTPARKPAGTYGEAWGAFLNEAKQEKPRAAAQLAAARIEQKGESDFTIYAGNARAVEYFCKPEIKSWITERFSAALGRQAAIEIVQDSAEAVVEPRKEEVAEETLEGDRLVKAITTTFEGYEVRRPSGEAGR